jgi:hypothetical protein
MIHSRLLRFVFSLAAAALLSSCQPAAPVTTLLPTIIPTRAPVCQTTFEHRELREPYKHGMNNAPRFTLDAAELESYYRLMNVTSLCVPPEAGAPFINVDWNAETGTAARGRMISLGFEGAYAGSGWSDIYLVRSTYDFSAGTEYDRFMTRAEWDAYKANTLEGIQRLPDGRGFTRFKAGLGYDSYPLFKTLVLPREDGYTALVVKLGTSEEEMAAALERLNNGIMPETASKWLPVFETMATSIR